MLLRTPLHAFHVSSGAKMVDFAGWEMPLLYRSIVDEHQQTRGSGSMFDVSHMGRIYFTGPDAAPLLDKALTRNLALMRVGQCRYSLICNESGGVIDDVIVSKDVKHWLVVCNASNRLRVVSHLQTLRDGLGLNAEIDDRTLTTAMIALQGPRVMDLLNDTLDIDLRSIKRYGFENGVHMMSRYTLSRTGYTGEDGVEIILSSGTATNMINSMSGELQRAESPIRPAGLGARDTLRLEAGMPLYGHELSEEIDPISAGLDWAVDLSKDFIGRDALAAVQESGPKRKLVGIEMQTRQIARPGFLIWDGQSQIGQVTSGTFAPTVQKSIAMAMIDAAFSAPGTQVRAGAREGSLEARVVALPFYDRNR